MARRFGTWYFLVRIFETPYHYLTDNCILVLRPVSGKDGRPGYQLRPLLTSGKTRTPHTFLLGMGSQTTVYKQRHSPNFETSVPNSKADLAADYA